MKLYALIMSLLFVSMQVFASNVPGAFGVKMKIKTNTNKTTNEIETSKPCNFPGICVLYKNCFDRYKDEQQPLFLAPFTGNDESALLSSNGNEALREIAKNLSFITDDETSLTIDKYGKLTPSLPTIPEYKTWIAVLKDEKINNLMKITHEPVETTEILNILRAKYIELASSRI